MLNTELGSLTLRPEIKEPLTEAIGMAQNRPLCRDCCPHLVLRTPSGACQKRRRHKDISQCPYYVAISVASMSMLYSPPKELH